jgi:thiol-disulfide isomerase/thioredoxin
MNLLRLAFLVGVFVHAAASAAPAAEPPPLRGSGGQFVFMKPSAPVPATAVERLDGSAARLQDLHGRVVLVNVWATWCLPCVYEMPSLDRLAGSAPPGLAVVALSIDRAGAAAVAPFAAAHGLTHLPLYLDPQQRLVSLTAGRPYPEMLPLWSLPISYVIDRDGLVVGYLPGVVDWDSPAARAFLRYFLDRPS